MGTQEEAGRRREKGREGMERASWSLDGMLTLENTQASCLGCMWEPGGWSPYSCLLQPGMPRDNRVSRMYRKVNRYEENRKAATENASKGEAGILCTVLTVVL